MRAELFGYVRGAFTGAGQDRDGLLKTADGDTLFLDEIGDLARDTQRLLIRALEDGRFQPLGSQKWEESRFRLVAATNVPLPVLKKRLDADFFDRIAMVRLTTPPLRLLRADLPALWEAVWARVLRESGATPPEGLDQADGAVLDFLRRHPLPGNLRDLYALAWRILVRWRGQGLKRNDLRDWLPSALPVEGPAGPGQVDELFGRLASGRPLDDLLTGDVAIAPKKLLQEFKRRLAREVRRVGKSRSVDPATLVRGLTAKSLREWASGPDR